MPGSLFMVDIWNLVLRSQYSICRKKGTEEVEHEREERRRRQERRQEDERRRKEETDLEAANFCSSSRKPPFRSALGKVASKTKDTLAISEKVAR